MRIVHRNGTKKSRLDGPAVIRNNRNSIIYEWWVDGRNTRKDGPAIEVWEDDDLIGYEYKLNGFRHRVNGPAVQYPNYEAWYYKGRKHRIGDYAVKDTRAWVPNYERWENGKKVSIYQSQLNIR